MTGKLSPQDALDRAMGWIAVGAKVFPCQPDDRRFLPEGWPEEKRPPYKAPLTARGFYDASDDFEAVATTWLVDYPGALVGVWMGGSNLIALDIDKKNGKDGFASIKARGLPLGDTWKTPTAAGGEHRVFASDKVDVRPGADILGLPGVDLRAGGSYIIAWADAPETRDAFSGDIPEWMLTDASRDDFTGVGFSGSVQDWLDTLSQEVLPSSRTREFMASIPNGEFDHVKMVELVWNVVRLGSENEDGVITALEALKSAWLRGEFDTPVYRRDFDLALRGAIAKAGKVQRPIPAMRAFIGAMQVAERAGARKALDAIERGITEKLTPADFARARKALFEACAERGVDAGTALSIVTRSKAYRLAEHISIESAWFSEGEPVYAKRATEADAPVGHEFPETPTEPAEPSTAGPEADTVAERGVLEEFTRIKEKDGGTFLTDDEVALRDSGGLHWWGDDYLDWVRDSLDHFNGPYHRMLRWIVLSVIASPWGSVPKRAEKPMGTTLYGMALGPSTSGKSQAWGMAQAVIDAFYGTENSPIIGDTKKISAIALHHHLLRRDALPSMVYSDEVQGFFKDLTKSHWQGTVLADLSDYYGGEVKPKLMLNDKEFSGKRGSTKLTTYFTGIANLTLDSITIDQWIDGFFFRFLWTFSEPVFDTEDDDIVAMAEGASAYSDKPREWADEFKRVSSLQELRYGLNRLVQWDDDALKRMTKFSRDIRVMLQKSSLWDNVYKPLNRRFVDSMLKCATLVALIESSETVKLRHVLIAIDQAWEWHRAAIMAVSETQIDPFFRTARELFDFCRKNASTKVGSDPIIQRALIMRERRFGTARQIDDLLIQLIAEGWLHREGDFYRLPAEERRP